MSKIKATYKITNEDTNLNEQLKLYENHKNVAQHVGLKLSIQILEERASNIISPNTTAYNYSEKGKKLSKIIEQQSAN